MSVAERSGPGWRGAVGGAGGASAQAWRSAVNVFRHGHGVGAVHAVDQMGVALCDPSLDIDEVVHGSEWGSDANTAHRCPACDERMRSGEWFRPGFASAPEP